MTVSLRVGVLAFHGDVSEHIWATETAAHNLKLDVEMISVRTQSAAESLDALIIPGGESTTLYKLMARENMLETIKKIPAIMGTCAGAILLARKITNPADDQQSLGLMDITVTRNAYGRQDHSFETDIETPFATTPVAFIRAPRIEAVGAGVELLAVYNKDPIVCEQKIDRAYYLALTCHPELTTSKFHEYFLKHL